MALRIVEAGIVVMGPPCSLFIAMSWRYHRRTVKRPWGNESRRDVCVANAIARNVFYLCNILTLRGVYWIVEHPATGWLFKLPCEVLGYTKTVGTCLSAFSEHASLKPIHLLSTLPYVSRLRRRGQRVLKKAYGLSKNKKWKANDHTRASGSYPIMFALAIYGVWQQSAKHRLGV